MSDIDPFDPVTMAMRSLHKSNVIAAKEARIAELEAENARLKAEVVHDINQIGGLQQENASLKADVEQIRKIVDEHLTPIPEHTTVREVERLCTAWSLMSNSLDAQWKRIEQLKAEVERLRKAGDELLENYKTHRVIFPSAVYAWNAAKEGKPSV